MQHYLFAWSNGSNSATLFVKYANWWVEHDKEIAFQYAIFILWTLYVCGMSFNFILSCQSVCVCICFHNKQKWFAIGVCVRCFFLLLVLMIHFISMGRILLFNKLQVRNNLWNVSYVWFGFHMKWKKKRQHGHNQTGASHKM